MITSAIPFTGTLIKNNSECVRVSACEALIRNSELKDQGANPNITEGGNTNELSELFGEAAQTAQGQTSEVQQGGQQEQQEQKAAADGGGKTDAVSPLTAADFTLPEGQSFDEGVGAGFLEALNDGKLSRRELGQRLLDMYIKQAGTAQAAREAEEKAANDAAAKEIAGWWDACKRDEEYGGAKWESSQAVIDRGTRRLASPECTAVLREFGLNRHPEIARMFYRAGLLVGEDRSGGAAAGAPARDPAELIFGESLKNYKR